MTRFINERFIPPFMAFSNERLRVFRREILDLSQPEFVDELNETALDWDLEYKVSLPNLRNWEQNKSTPHADALELLQVYSSEKGYSPLIYYDSVLINHNFELQ
jgi:DNA-binding transcriptional regulator YiaG